MNFIKKLMLALVVSTLVIPAEASRIHSALPAVSFGPQVKKEQAKRVIRRTAVVIHVARKKVREGKVYTGNLARAVAHQRLAIRLYREGKFFRAIHHSRRARHLAILAIKANKGAETADMRMTKEEQDTMKGGPSDTELDNALMKDLPDAPQKDEEVLDSEADTDLQEQE